MKFRSELRQKLELKPLPPPNLLPHYLLKSQCVAVQLQIFISKNNPINNSRQVFYKFLFDYLLFYS